jgi:hypothetical protein
MILTSKFHEHIYKTPRGEMNLRADVSSLSIQLKEGSLRALREGF